MNSEEFRIKGKTEQLNHLNYLLSKFLFLLLFAFAIVVDF